MTSYRPCPAELCSRPAGILGPGPLSTPYMFVEGVKERLPGLRTVVAPGYPSLGLALKCQALELPWAPSWTCWAARSPQRGIDWKFFPPCDPTQPGAPPHEGVESEPLTKSERNYRDLGDSARSPEGAEVNLVAWSRGWAPGGARRLHGQGADLCWRRCPERRPFPFPSPRTWADAPPAAEISRLEPQCSQSCLLHSRPAPGRGRETP